MDPLIELHGVGKRYSRLRERDGMRSIMPFAGGRNSDLWALRGIELTVEPGELVGVIGQNGAGKTTLLRLLAGVTRPTEGRVEVHGRIAPLISLGVGFHDEMSGRENVLVNGMMLGLTAAEVAERFEEIIAFAELDESVDTPVKFYSSGMVMRLGFAVAIHTEPSVLLVDEVLAVGDSAFQLKCFDRLRRFRDQGAAIVVVSHAMHQMRQLCRRGILLAHGRMVYDGEVERAIALHYETISAGQRPDVEGSSFQVLDQCLTVGGVEHHHADYDDPMELVLRLRCTRDAHPRQAEFIVRTDGGLLVGSHQLGFERSESSFGTGDEITVRVGFRARLGGGNYVLSIQLIDDAGARLGSADGLVLFVAGRPSTLGVLDLRAETRVDGVDRTDRRLSLLEG